MAEWKMKKNMSEYIYVWMCWLVAIQLVGWLIHLVERTSTSITFNIWNVSFSFWDVRFSVFGSVRCWEFILSLVYYLYRKKHRELLYLCIVVCLKEARRWQRRAKERANLYTDTSNDEIPFVIFVPFVYRLALDWHYSDWFQSLVSLSNFTIFRQSFHCLDTYISSIVFRCFLSISLFATFVHPAHQPDIGSKRFEFTPKNIFYYEKFFSLSLITCLFFRSFYHSQHYCPDVFGGDGVRYFFYSSDCDFNFSPILITPNSIVLISVCVLVCWCECDRVMRCES